MLMGDKNFFLVLVNSLKQVSNLNSKPFDLFQCFDQSP